MNKRQILRIITAAFLAAAAVTALFIPIARFGGFAQLAGISVGIGETVSLAEWIRIDLLGEKAVEFYGKLGIEDVNGVWNLIMALLSAFALVLLPVCATLIFWLRARARAVAGIVAGIAFEAVLAAKFVLINKIAKAEITSVIAEGEAAASVHFGLYVLAGIGLVCIALSTVLLILDLKAPKVEISRSITYEERTENKGNENPIYEIHGLTGMYAGAAFEIRRGETICFGRDADGCQIIFFQNNSAISRKHCAVFCDEQTGEFRIIDFSSNGTFIEGSRIAPNNPQIIPCGARFWLGNEENSFAINRR